MRKTPIKNLYLDRLAKVNDQLCYFHFADEELRQGLDRVQHDASAMTTDAFPRNEYAKRIHVRFDSLLDFSNRARAVSAGTSITLGVEHLLSYISDMVQLKHEISRVPAVHNDTDSPEDYLAKSLQAWGVAMVNPITGFIKTIKYLRIRRNHIAHARIRPTNRCRQFIRQHSHELNRFWNERTAMDGLDFASEDISSFSEPEAYTCMKLLRVCVEEIDLVVASTFDESDLVRYLKREALVRDARIADRPKIIVRKVCRRLDQDFGVMLKADVVKTHIEIVDNA